MVVLNGAMYLNKNVKCLIRLYVSLFSLRKVYSGPVSMLCDGPHSDEVKEILRKFNAELIEVETGQSPFVVKARLQDFTPYERTLFIDADTIILNPIDEIFEVIGKHKFFTTQFVSWHTSGSIMKGRIKGFKSIVGEDCIKGAIEYGPALNTGVFGFTKDAPILEEWGQVTAEADEKGVSKIPDEVGCQVIAHKYGIKVMPREWNESGKFCVREKDYNFYPEKIKILHFHGRKHCGDRASNVLWKQLFWEMYNTIIDVPSELFLTPNGDKSFAQYMERVRELRNKVTIVTAVNKKYWEKFQANFQKWMNTEGLFEHNFIVMTNGLDEDKKGKIAKLRNVEVFDWDYNGCSTREGMLAAFVLFAPKLVKTPFWMKLDADVTPKGTSFTWKDEYFQGTIAGHKWGYTKVKGDDTNTHWLNTLDKWWEEKTGQEPIFPPITGAKHRHPRVCSFVQINDTEFTRLVAEMCGDWIPIPSQDTLHWYVAHRLNAPILRTNFKKEMAP